VWVREPDVCLRACKLTYLVCHAQSPYFLRSLAPPYSSTFSHKRHDIRKKVTEHKMCVLIFCTSFIRNIFSF
jgi:hypothetical protein